MRTHPHMRLKPADDLEDWMAAVREAAPDVHFDPSSPVDSYALMARADIVFTYGSTAGIEAAFMGKPVVVMGPSAYDLLGCAQRVTRASEMPYVLDHPPDPDPAATLPYGLMMQRRGFTYAHLVKGPDGTPVLEGIPLAEASENVRKASDALLKARTRWLTQA